MNNKIIYDGEDMIGFAGDIFEDLLTNTNTDERDEEVMDLFTQLALIDRDTLIRVSYHPMGAWVIKRYKEI